MTASEVNEPVPVVKMTKEEKKAAKAAKKAAKAEKKAAKAEKKAAKAAAKKRKAAESNSDESSDEDDEPEQKKAKVESEPEQPEKEEEKVVQEEAPAATATTDGKQTGTVNWFNSEKGFGFISPTDGSNDLFVHQSSIYAEGFRALAEGEAVEYTVETGNNGKLCAKNVTGPGGVAVKGDGQGGNGGYQQQGGRRPAGVCYAFQKGNCRFDDCKFSHDASGASDGGSKNSWGGSSRPQGKCYAFQENNCHRGDACKFAH